MLDHHSPREGEEVKGRAEVALNKIGLGAGQFRQLADLDLTVLRQGANRNNRCFEAPEQRDDDFLDGAELEDRAIAGFETELEQ